MKESRYFFEAVIARSSCDEAIQGPQPAAPGSLRYARDDAGGGFNYIGRRLSAGLPAPAINSEQFNARKRFCLNLLALR